MTGVQTCALPISSGEYAVKRSAEYGIIRKAGTKATDIMDFTGIDGTIILKGKVYLTPDGLQFEVDETVTITFGAASVGITATEVGSEYNVGAGTITQQIVNQKGVTTFSNRGAIGGTDEETIASLVDRLYDYLKNPATSGNLSHYKQWALAVDGVGGAKVTPLWDGAGTVKVLIVGSNKQPVDSAVVENCFESIEANRPVGATVTVISAEGLAINVTAAVIIDSTTTVDAVQTAFSSALDAYLKFIAFERYELVYNRIAYMLLDIEGVIDYTSLTINGGTTNITIGDDQVPILGALEVNI